METTSLSRVGTVWTWTTQDFRPKLPYRGEGTDADFEPFVLGYVELEDGVRIESHLLVDRHDIHIGMRVALVIAPLYQNDAGEEVVTFAFAATN